mmetsp:Transcript_13579/g.16487  ORF Transcript_13579/g.16487 Transcript_13579/m.16487 type:complete len:309 (-) Transcript_13579:228-1154(-)
MTRLTILVSACLISCTFALSFDRSTSLSSWGTTQLVGSIPRGGDASYGSLCEDVKSSIIAAANKQIEEMRAKIIDEGTTIDSFGQKADTLCNQALEQFATQAPDAGDDATSASTYDTKLQELEAALDAPLQVLYLRQLALLREKALQTYRAASRMTETSDYEAMLNADSQFASAAESSTREVSDWDYAGERSHLQSIMNDLASTKKKLMDVQMKNSEKQSTAMAFLQQQQQMIQQLQQQLYGQTSPWNLGAAYRIPDTNFNLQGSYQQGRANLQMSCVPDEYAPMLGANGFTNGVGPGNLGLSVNLSV